MLANGMYQASCYRTIFHFQILRQVIIDESVDIDEKHGKVLIASPSIMIGQITIGDKIR